MLDHVYKESLWCYGVAVTDNLSFAHLVTRANQIFDRNNEYFCSLRSNGAKFEYFVGLFLDENQAEVLSPEVMAYCGERGISLILNLYIPKQVDVE